MRRQYTSKGQAPLAPITLDGVEFTPQGTPDAIDLVELASFGGITMDDPEGAAAMVSFLRKVFGDDGYTAFRRHCAEHKTDNDTLFAIIADVVEEITARPTLRPSQSGGGPPTTGTTSPDPLPLPDGPVETVFSDRLGTVTRMPLTAEREAELRAAVRTAEADATRAGQVDALGGEVQRAG